MIALDTHCWIWFHLGDPRLSKSIEKLVDGSSLLSAASIWETLILLERGRLVSSRSPADTVDRWLQAMPMRVVPIDRQIATLSRTLAFQHDDPLDRFIAATAHREGARLATVDARLRKLKWLETID